MSTTPQPAQPLLIAGLSIRTTNAEAPQTIGALWQRYSTDAACQAAQLALGAARNSAVYAVYTDFDHPNPAQADILVLGYRLVIGVPVPQSPARGGLDSVVIEPAKRQVFEVASCRPQDVGPMWQRIWADASLKRRFLTDFERYGGDGTIGIHVSVT